MYDFEKTIISQYANAPTLTQLIADVNAWLEADAPIDEFYSKVWNIDTAEGYGLDIWGRIVGVSRVVQIPVTPLYFGFFENIGYAVGFNQGPFWNGTEPLLQNYDLSDDDFRRLILAKALYNISGGSIPEINQLLLNLFPGRGNCYVVDYGGMNMVYYFNFALTVVDTAILTQTGILPTPTGVAWRIQQT